MASMAYVSWFVAEANLAVVVAAAVAVVVTVVVVVEIASLDLSVRDDHEIYEKSAHAID